MVTSISAPITSILGTLQHHNHFIEGSLHPEKYAINVNKIRNASIVSALLCVKSINIFNYGATQ